MAPQMLYLYNLSPNNTCHCVRQSYVVAVTASGVINVPIDVSAHTNTTGCSLGCILPLSKVICRKLTRGKQVLRHILIANVNHVTVVRYNP